MDECCGATIYRPGYNLGMLIDINMYLCKLSGIHIHDVEGIHGKERGKKEIDNNKR